MTWNWNFPEEEVKIIWKSLIQGLTWEAIYHLWEEKITKTREDFYNHCWNLKNTIPIHSSHKCKVRIRTTEMTVEEMKDQNYDLEV